MSSDVLIKENKNNKPFVRIIEAELDNFKIVGHGKIVFSCGKEKVPYNTKSDILGIYGQNGSGKTSFIEALDILRILMSGGSIPDDYSDCITKDKEYAKVSFTFDFQYPNGIVRTVKYEFKLKLISSNENLNMDYENDDINISALDDRTKNNHIQVFDEIVFVTGPFGDKSIKMQSIMDTSLNDGVFGPVTKRKFFIDLSKYKFSEIKKDLVVYKKLALEKSQSFVFMDKVLNIFQEKGNDSDFFHVLLELKYYASYFLKVIRTRDYALIRAGRTYPFELPLPIYFRFSNTDKPMLFKSGIIVSEKLYEKLDILFSNMNLILKELIPSIDIKLKKLSPALLKSGEAGFVVDLVSIRYGIELPIRVESDGIKKLISSLNLIIEVFHNPYSTIVIDEFDAGVFEYLLGELLEIIESKGKGQFIFTSHNLHPLEILKNKKFLIFTTTNPQNRYIHLKNIYPTHNLRDRYYNEILTNERDEKKNEQDEILYTQSKHNKIIEAFKKAGSTEEFDGLGLPLKMDIRS